jgi:hypothetical protein
MRIENWEVEDLAKGGQWIVGRVYDSPSHSDGKYIHTSRIVELDLKNRTVTTLNSVYELGTPRGGDA